MGIFDHRRTWRCDLAALAGKCVTGFVEAFSWPGGPGGLGGQGGLGGPGWLGRQGGLGGLIVLLASHATTLGFTKA